MEYRHVRKKSRLSLSAAFGGVGVGLYAISDNSAKFAEFAAFARVGVGVGHFRYFDPIRRIHLIRAEGGRDSSEHHFR